jgi:ribosomal protein S18 acetylase RimI-like enzyme
VTVHSLSVEFISQADRAAADAHTALQDAAVHSGVLSAQARERFDGMLEHLLSSGARVVVVSNANGPIARCVVGLHSHEAPVRAYAGFFLLLASSEHERKTAAARAIEASMAVSRSLGAVELLAPMDLHSWLSYRLRDDEHALEFGWEPPRDRSLEAALREHGFNRQTPYWSIGSRRLADVAAYCQPHYRAALDRGHRVVSFGSYSGEGDERLMRFLWSLSQRSFANSPYFQPISFEFFARFYATGLASTSPELGRVLLSPEGEEIGFLWCFVDGDTLILKSMAVDPRYQGQKLGEAVSYEGLRAAADAGVDHYVSALMLKGNRSEFFSRAGETLWHHEYAVWSLRW